MFSKYALATLIILSTFGLYHFGIGTDWTWTPFGEKEQVFDVPDPLPFVEKMTQVEEESLSLGDGDPSDRSAPSGRPSAASPTSATPVASINLAVPFTPQAPFATWDHTHQETCEEAALYMVHEFYARRSAGLIPPEEAEAVLLDMVEREIDLFGFFEDTTVAEMAQFATAYYGYTNVEILENPSVDELKRVLDQGYPIIVPVSGRTLANPYYSGEGPLYHAIVLKGYTEEGFRSE